MFELVIQIGECRLFLINEDMLYLFTGCLAPTEATLETIITDSSGAPLSLAEIVVYDEEAVEYSSTSSDEDGFISVEIPPLETFFVALSADEFITTSFTGYAGDGLFAAPEGSLYLRSEAELLTLASLFTSCEPTGYPAIDGNVRLDIPHQAQEDLPLLSGVLIEGTSSTEETFNACYTENNSTEDGTGTSGVFGFFDLAEGLYTLKARLNSTEDSDLEIEYPFFLPENGNIPVYPLFFPLPS
ncbi:MAG: hypothetical protein CMK59_10455 [Proteobacteria bacterium]|nr:hypothetical protein [Pseudomonadota bacterium]